MREKIRLGTQVSGIEMYSKTGGGTWETRRDQESRRLKIRS